LFLDSCSMARVSYDPRVGSSVAENDQQLVRAGFAMILDAAPDMEVSEPPGTAPRL
jgi:hypothetical protein